MKNYFRLNLIVMMLALPFIFSSCNSDDNLPDVKIALQETGGVQSQGNLYVKNGDTIDITNVSIVADESTPNSMITACDYYWDGYFVGPAFAPAFNRSFIVYNQPLGCHYLTVRMLVAAQGYSLATYVTQIPVIVVEDTSTIEPDNTDLFSRVSTTRQPGDSQMPQTSDQ